MIVAESENDSDYFDIPSTEVLHKELLIRGGLKFVDTGCLLSHCLYSRRSKNGAASITWHLR